jgi:hypothetical protein
MSLELQALGQFKMAIRGYWDAEYLSKCHDSTPAEVAEHRNRMNACRNQMIGYMAQLTTPEYLESAHGLWSLLDKDDGRAPGAYHLARPLMENDGKEEPAVAQPCAPQQGQFPVGSFRRGVAGPVGAAYIPFQGYAAASPMPMMPPPAPRRVDPVEQTISFLLDNVPSICANGSPGCTFPQMLQFNFQQMTTIGDYIQSRFPTGEPSPVHPFAPVFSQEDIQRLKSHLRYEQVRANFLTSLGQFAGFCGGKYNPFTHLIEPDPVYRANFRAMMANPDNGARICRVIDSMKKLYVRDVRDQALLNSFYNFLRTEALTMMPYLDPVSAQKLTFSMNQWFKKL